MAKSTRKDAPTAPEWFYDENGERLGVLENERARARWHEEHDTPDPAKENAARIVARSHSHAGD